MNDPLAALEAAALLGPAADDVGLRLDALLAGAPEDGGDDAGGRQWLGRACLRRSELRMARQDVDGAIDDIQRAGALLPEGSDDLIRAQLHAARLLLRSFKPARATEVIEETRPEVRGRARRVRAALALADGELAIDTRRPQPAADLFRRAYGLLGPGAEDHDRWQALMGIAVAEQLLGSPEGAVPWVKLALGIATGSADARRIAESAFALANLSLAPANPDANPAEARAAYCQALDSGALAPEAEPVALLGLARLDLEAGAYADAVRRAVAGAKAAAAVGNPAAFADGALVAGRAQAASGDRAEARRTCDAAITVLRRQNAGELARLVEAARDDLDPPA